MNWKRVTLQSVDSTNHVARSCPDTDVVITAEYQTVGHGQGDNTWESEAGKNLLFSLKIAPRGLRANAQFVLSMAVALAIKAAVEPFGSAFTLKWPNDIYFQDSKISGTLIETTIVGKVVSDCIIGVGVNVNQRKFRSAPHATSLALITNEEIDREKVLTEILHAFETYYQSVAEGAFEHIYDQYNASLYRRGKWALYADRDGSFEGKILHAEPSGHLLVQDRGGMQRRYESKELTFII